MKLLVCNSGASYATGDVHRGLLNGLRELGHDCIEYRLDSRIDMSHLWMQYIWRRAGRPKESRPTTADTLYHAGVQMIERALFFKVDGVLMISGMFILQNIMEMANRAGLHVGMVCTESPYDQHYEARWLRFVDVAWTNERSSVDYLRTYSGNPHVYYLPHAYDPAQHTPEPEDADAVVAQHDVVFVGSLFWERVDTLSAIDWSGIDFGLYGEWSGLGSRHRLRKFVRGGITNNRTSAALYRQAKVGLNLYRQSIGWGKDAPRIEHAESINPRALELAACGVFQIGDDRAEVREIFGDSVQTYRTPQELESSIRRALAEPDWRMQSAAEARQRILGPQFTFAARAAQVSAQLEEAWATRLAKGA